MVIYAFDLSMTGNNHTYFNSAILNMMGSIYKCRIYFYGEKHHIKLVNSMVCYENIIYKPLKISNYLGYKILYSDITAFFNFFKTFCKISSSSDDMFLVLNRNPITLLLCNFLNVFYKRKIINVLHGELEYLVNNQLKGLTRYYYKIYKLAYKISSSYNTYIFLGESIKNVVLKKGICFNNAKLVEIDHPYGYNATKNNNNLQKKEYFVSNIGTAAVRKNSQYILELKQILNKTKANVKIRVIGTVEDSLRDDFEKSKIQFNRSKINKEAYEYQISETDYSLCFFTSDMNIALASGSFFDCIKFEKPILALKGNPFVDYYFEKLGDIGYRFNNVKEMAFFLSKLDCSENSHYLVQVKNMEKAHEILSLENIGKSFYKQMLEL